jgi:hypothetical protein
VGTSFCRVGKFLVEGHDDLAVTCLILVDYYLWLYNRICFYLTRFSLVGMSD